MFNVALSSSLRTSILKRVSGLDIRERVVQGWRTSERGEPHALLGSAAQLAEAILW